AKLSQRLGEGVLNGLLTARLGLAAIDVTARCRSPHCRGPRSPISPRTCCANATTRRRLSGAIAGLNKKAAQGRPDLILFKPGAQKSSAINRKPGRGELASHSRPRSARERDGRQAPQYRPAPARNKPAAAEGAATPERHRAT